MSSKIQKDSKASVFIVEDSVTARSLLIKILEFGGFKVSGFAGDGKEAVEKFKHQIEVSDARPDIILMDYHLPLKNGIDATKEIRAIDEHAKIIFLSANDYIKEEALASGAIEFIEKPYTIEVVTNTIEKVLKIDMNKSNSFTKEAEKGKDETVGSLDAILDLYQEFESENFKNSVSINRKLKNLIRKLLKTVSKEEYLTYWFLIQMLFKIDILDEYHNGAKSINSLNISEHKIYSEIVFAEFSMIN